jgi:Cu/Ag efflux pump CusA
MEVLETVQTAFQGTIVGQVHEGNQAIGVSVIAEPKARRDPETIGSLMVGSAAGSRIPLSQLADIFPNTGRYSISHEGARRRQTITCSVVGRDVTSFVKAAKQQVARKVKFPSGTYAVFSGAAEARAAAQTQLFLNSAVGATGILLLLWIALGTWPNLLLVLLNIPFALVGGVLALAVFALLKPEESAVSIGSLVGFVTLFGISTRNSIMMISHFYHLVHYEKMTWGPQTVLRGASERLIPILITASVTALGLLPLALGAGEAGREIEGPMAIVILGGLVTSTLLNLLVLPTLALRFGRFHKTWAP